MSDNLKVILLASALDQLPSNLEKIQEEIKTTHNGKVNGILTVPSNFDLFSLFEIIKYARELANLVKKAYQKDNSLNTIVFVRIPPSDFLEAFSDVIESCNFTIIYLHFTE